MEMNSKTMQIEKENVSESNQQLVNISTEPSADEESNTQPVSVRKDVGITPDETPIEVHTDITNTGTEVTAVTETLVPEVTNDSIEELDTTEGESVEGEDMMQKDILPNEIINPPEVGVTENADHEQRIKIEKEANLLVNENDELDKAKSLCEINQTEQKIACPDIVTTEA